MKKIVLVPTLLGVMAIGGVIAVAGGNITGSANDSKKLSVEEIEKKALAEVNGTIREVDFETVGTKSFYEVEVLTKDAEYDLKIDAFTGELLRKKKVALDDDDFAEKKVVHSISNDDTRVQNVKPSTNVKENDDKSSQSNTTLQNTTNQITKATEKQQSAASSPAPQKTITQYKYDDDDFDDKDDDRYEDDDDSDERDQYDDDYDDDDRYDD